MPTIVLQVASSTDDARNLSGNGAFNATNTTYRLGDDAGINQICGFRFVGDLSGPIDLTPLKGATINSAMFDLFSAQTGQGTTAKVIFYGEDADSTATFSNSTAGKPEGRTPTTATVAKDFDVANFNKASAFGNDPVDLTAIIQEIVDRPGWDGASLVIIGRDNGSATSNNIGFATFNASGNDKGARLIIDYTIRSSRILAVNGEGAITSGWNAEGGDYTRLLSDDGDGSRLYTPTPGDVRLVTLTDTGLKGVKINSVTVYAKVRSLDPVSNTVQIGVYTHSNLYWSADKDTYPSTDYILFSETWTVNPATGDPWTPEELDDLQIGLRKTNGVGMGWTYAYVVVDYEEKENSPPLIELHTPDKHVFNTPTPKLEFTGTDPDGDDISYNVVIHSFLPDSERIFRALTSSEAAHRRVGGFTDSGTSGIALHSGISAAQIFEADIGANDTSVIVAKLRLRRVGSGGSYFIFLTELTEGKPDLFEVLSGTLDPVAFDDVTTDTNGEWVKVWWPADPSFTINASGQYALVMFNWGGGADPSNHIEWLYAPQGSYPHNALTDNDFGDSWSDVSGQALQFELHKQTLIEATSDVSPGFVNEDNNADTDPFTSGDKISFMLNLELPEDAYYWSVIGIDPGGTGEAGEASETRKFFVSFGPSFNPAIARRRLLL